MANLVVMKRKDAELGGHGFSMFVDPKRIKLQEAEILEMMEEEKPLAGSDAHAGAPPANNVQPTMLMPSPQLPTQAQEAAADSTVGTASGSRSSESPSDQAAPMDVEEDVRQSQPPSQPSQHPHFWSGFF